MAASARGLTASDLAFIIEKRAHRAGWDGIAAMLNVPTDAVRRAVDPSYTPAHKPGGAVAAISPQQGLIRRLKADGCDVVTAERIAAVYALGGGPVSIEDVLERAGHLTVAMGQTAVRGAGNSLKRDAAAAGYPLEITRRGISLTSTAAAAIAERLANRVR